MSRFFANAVSAWLAAYTPSFSSDCAIWHRNIGAILQTALPCVAHFNALNTQYGMDSPENHSWFEY